MLTNDTRFKGGPSRNNRPSLVDIVLAAFVAWSIVVPGGAQAQNQGHHKIAPDFANFSVNSDGTVDVIIQFTEKLQAKHFEMMAEHGGKLKHSFQHIQGAAYRIPVALLDFLENHPDVAYVTPDRQNKSFDDAAEVYPAAVMAAAAQSQYALNGTGVGIAIIDSGIYKHPDLQNSSQTASRIVYSQSFVSGDTTTNDAYGHGTHVSGIVAGNGSSSQTGYASPYIGIAPNANLINLRVLDQNGSGTDSQVIAAIEEAIQVKNTYNIRVINLSLGRPVYESYTLDPLCQAAEAAWQAGIVVVVAAGNSGRDNTYSEDGYGTISAPGNDPNVITVGATNDKATATRNDDIIASYSSKGPTLIDHIMKPDLVAPGNRLISLLSPNSTIANSNPSFLVSPSGSAAGQYLVLSGTSMATPVVSGAAALMVEQNPNLTPDTVKARMMKTAWKGYPVSSTAYDTHGNSYFSRYDIFTIGAGYLDIDAALGSTDVANGGAASPVAVFNSSTEQVSLVNGTSITWGASILWGSSIVWSDSIVWGGALVGGQSIISDAGAGVVWSDTTVSANSIIWSPSVVSNPSAMSALATGDDGDN